jgi:tRNA threonylcarbamoyladenosine biosynthesis protein TsaE
VAQTLKIISNSPEDTRKTGITIAKRLKPGVVIALTGVLGAGKTTLVQGICQGLGAEIPASSPSFVIVNNYPSVISVYHLDLYRLKSLQELIDLGYEEYFYGEGICLVEWAEKARELLPGQRWDIELKIVDENQREILVTERA